MIRVASYCRVSTDKEDQINSFESQQRYFSDYIRHHPDWELYEVYADEGITGTSTRKRVQFNRMMEDARSGRFSLLLTKEVSRFSRNILDTIACTRELKALGVGVIFMSDGFSSIDPDAELRLSIMGSIAQEESRKTSARVKWGQTRQMERGVVFGTSMLGYCVKNGKLTPEPQGAEVVRLIFQKYGVEKKGTSVIARELQDAGFRTQSGSPVWNGSCILKILKNEKYAGDLVQKKTFTPDYLTHDRKNNHGEETLVILRDHHEPIVSRQLWDLVQEELGKRNRNNGLRQGHSRQYLLSGKIRCGQCGAAFVSRVKRREDGSSYRRWGCYTAVKYGSQRGCDVGKVIRDDLAVSMLVEAVRSLDLEQMTDNAVTLAAKVSGADNQLEHLNRQLCRVRDKKAAAVDAYLEGILSSEELVQVKSRYESQLLALEERIRQTSPGQPDETALLSRGRSISTCETISEPFLKSLLESMTVYRDGRVEVKLNNCAAIWIFQLEQGR